MLEALTPVTHTGKPVPQVVDCDISKVLEVEQATHELAIAVAAKDNAMNAYKAMWEARREQDNRIKSLEAKVAHLEAYKTKLVGHLEEANTQITELRGARCTTCTGTVEATEKALLAQDDRVDALEDVLVSVAGCLVLDKSSSYVTNIIKEALSLDRGGK
jgi:predicted RNase H-like nuclease (RuvC/YqgF family)